MTDIAIYGGNGRIGSVVRDALSVRAYDQGELAPLTTRCVIWCATRHPDHANLGPFVEDLSDFLALLERHSAAERIIFTSSFGIEDIEGNPKAINPYAAGKIAGEAFVHAWQKGAPSRSAAIVRIGAFGYPHSASHWAAMEADEIAAVYGDALRSPAGETTVLSPRGALFRCHQFAALLACYRSGQVPESAWQEHLEDPQLQLWLSRLPHMDRHTCD